MKRPCVCRISMNATTFKSKLIWSDCTANIIFQKGGSSSYPLQYTKSTLSEPQAILHNVSRSYGSGIQEEHRRNGSLLFHDIWALNGEDFQWLALEQLKLEESLSRWLYFIHLPGPWAKRSRIDCLRGVIQLGDLRVFRLLTCNQGLKDECPRRCHVSFYNLALEVTQHHFCHMLDQSSHTALGVVGWGGGRKWGGYDEYGDPACGWEERQRVCSHV